MNYLIERILNTSVNRRSIKTKEVVWTGTMEEAIQTDTMGCIYSMEGGLFQVIQATGGKNARKSLIFLKEAPIPKVANSSVPPKFHTGQPVWIQHPIRGKMAGVITSAGGSSENINVIYQTGKSHRYARVSPKHLEERND